MRQNLKQQMEFGACQPCNKGSNPDPDKLARRIEFLLTYLSEKYNEQPV